MDVYRGTVWLFLGGLCCGVHFMSILLSWVLRGSLNVSGVLVVVGEGYLWWGYSTGSCDFLGWISFVDLKI